MHGGRTTLTQFIIEEQRRVAGATGDFSGLLNDIATACKVISNHVGKGSLANSVNTECSGVSQAPTMDQLANKVMLDSNVWAGHLAGIASQEMTDIFPIPLQYPRGKYLLAFDPLDGSSNIDLNVAVGTIFSILKAPTAGAEASPADFLQPGCEQVCAGFALYGPATLIILTTGNGVNGFTLDHDIGEFVLSHPQMSIPADACEFAINASNERFWEPPVRRYIDECLDGKAGVRGKDFNMRWIASLVAETYRILTRGGVFLYPMDEKTRAEGGRVRLLYEANPIAMIVEQAGGMATTSRGTRVLEICPHSIHERVPFVFGARHEIERIVSYHQDYLAGHVDGAAAPPLFSSRSLFRT